MTTTTRKTLETDEVVGEQAADPGEAQLVIPRAMHRTPKPWPMAVLCFLGGHRGQWTYSTESNCAQARECERCGSLHVRIKHKHEWRYVREDACEQIRCCGRCNDVKGKRVSHEWGKTYDIETRWWQGDREGHRCLRCGREEEWSDNYD